MALSSADTLTVSAKKSAGGAVSEALELALPRLSTIWDLAASLAEHESTDPAQIVVVRSGQILKDYSDALTKWEANGRVEIIYIVRGNPTSSAATASVAAAGLEIERAPAQTSDAYRELFVTHVLESYYKKLHLQDLIDGLPPWKINLGGTAHDPLPRLSFGPTVSFEVQLLGSESYDSKTWLQGRCQQVQGIHPGLLQASIALRDLGIFEFATDRLEQQGVPLWQGNWIAMVACGVLGSKAYYSGPTGPYGAVFFLITDNSFSERIPALRYDAARILRTIGEGLDMFASKAPQLPPADVLHCIHAFIAARGGVVSVRDCDTDNTRVHAIQANGEDVGFLKVGSDGKILQMSGAFQPNLPQPEAVSIPSSCRDESQR